MLEPAVCLPLVLERQARAVGSDEGRGMSDPLGAGGIFYDLRHEALLRVMGMVWGEKGTLDTIVLQQQLRDWNQLEAIGGMGYIAGLMNCVPSASAAVVGHYLGILWEKFLARRLLAVGAKMERRVFDLNGLDERNVGAIEREFGEFKEMADRSFGGAPNVLKRAEAFGERAFARWFHELEEIPGWRLPFAFPLGLRTGETSLMSGDNGSGKTSMLCQMAVEVAKQIETRQKTGKGYGTGEERVCIAAFEQSPDVLIWIMQRQVLGVGRLPNNDEGHALFAKSLGWLNRYFWFHDFVGIGSWRDVLDVFAYARDHENCRFFELDSIMRIGIPEDDLSQQALASAAMSTFAMEPQRESHLVVVGHENKAGVGAKNRVQGSKRWTDNTHLHVQMERNEAREEKMAEAKELMKSREEEDRVKGRKMQEDWVKKWGAKFLLHKQRYPGAPQNGSAHLFFDGGRDGSLQFRKDLEEGAICYLD